MPAPSNLRRALAAVVATLSVATLVGAAPASAGDGSNPGPSNDDRADALVLAGPSGVTQGDTALATHEPGEPDHGLGRTHASVWYRWTAPQAGQVTFSTELSRFDTVLSVYVIDDEGGLAAVFADHRELGQDEREIVDVTAGSELFVVVDGAQGERGRYVLAWHFGGAPPPNDARGGSRTLDHAYGQLHTTTAGAKIGRAHV